MTDGQTDDNGVIPICHPVSTLNGRLFPEYAGNEH